MYIERRHWCKGSEGKNFSIKYNITRDVIRVQIWPTSTSKHSEARVVRFGVEEGVEWGIIL
jgi:hypothetical protein